MARISWLPMHTEQLLLLFNCFLFMIPTITSQICHLVPQTLNGDPIVEISTSQSVNSLRVSTPLNLTCTARLTDNIKYVKDPDFRPGSIIWWDPQVKIARECKAGKNPAAVMNCILVLDRLNEETIGNYTCQASTVDSLCTMKSIKIDLLVDIQTPKIFRVPMNHSAGIGSNATFHCTASGYPKPTITWAKDNDTNILQSNSRVKVDTNLQKGHSQLVIAGVKNEDYGAYRCVASNRAGSRTSTAARLYPKTLKTIDIQKPEIVEAPLNRSANIGSNVTFNCTAIGDPQPTITWIKYNESDFLKSNPRAKVVLDLKKGHSQLIITGVANEDYGEYQCVARNNAGMKTSRKAFLGPGIVAPSKFRSAKSSIALQASSSNITVIVVLCVVFTTMVICGIVGLLWYRRSRSLNETCDVERIQMADVPSTDSVDLTISMEAELTPSKAMFSQDMTENTYDTIGTPNPFSPAQDQEKLQQLLSVKNEVVPGTGLLAGAFRVDLPKRTLQTTRELPPTPNEAVPPERPPKPRRKDNTEQQVVCSCMLQSESRGPRLQKSDTLNSQDSGYDSTESRESIFVEHDIVVDGESLSSKDNDGSWEIDLERLEVLEEVLGKGEFGVVKKGRYYGQDKTIIDVAVKQLKDTTSMSDKDDLLSEIKILKQAGRHPNIVNLVGACTQKEKVLVVTELIPGGSLENFLRSKRIEYSSGERSKYENVHFGLNDRQLHKIALQIASGMRHLEERKCIHRDLAARNVFIDENNVAKVGDFGMARDVSDDGIYTKTSSGKVPWRWLSLESLKEQVYTSRSDVWSFGIVLWEIATYGEEPYPEIATPADLITSLSKGYRMSIPEHCSGELYEMMSSCWMENPLMRPTFADITKRLKYHLREFKRKYINLNDDGIASDSEDSQSHQRALLQQVATAEK